jgi:hypothetical protein
VSERSFDPQALPPGTALFDVSVLLPDLAKPVLVTVGYLQRPAGAVENAGMVPVEVGATVQVTLPKDMPPETLEPHVVEALVKASEHALWKARERMLPAPPIGAPRGPQHPALKHLENMRSLLSHWLALTQGADDSVEASSESLELLLKQLTLATLQVKVHWTPPVGPQEGR